MDAFDPPDEPVHPPRVLVLDRGFVLVGRCRDLIGVGLYLEVTECRTIRRWGTTAGLTQLAAGPTPTTVFDAPTREVIPVRAILRQIDVEVSKWETLYPMPSLGGRTTPGAEASSATSSKRRSASPSR